MVIGGLHATTVPDQTACHCDAVVIGEGEPVWLDVLHDVEQNQLKSVYRGDLCGFDLATSPVPAYELLDIDKYNRLTVQTSRGCPHRCEFCASSVLLTRRYKQKPIANVLAEIDRICEVWDNPFIEFADDNAIVNRAYWKELLPHLESRNIRWFAETDISVAKDEKLLAALRRAGCMQLLIGLESPTSDALSGLERNSNWKQKQWDRYKDAIRTIQSYGISVNGCFVVGLDGHDTSIFENIKAFLRESGLHEVQVTIPTPFPGTAFYDRLEREGRLKGPVDFGKLTLFDLMFEPARMTADELTQGFRKLVEEIYNDEWVARRKKAFKRCIREGRRSRSQETAPRAPA